MPVEIRELHIRINVNEQEQNAEGTATEPSPREQQGKKDALVAECIEQTLQIIEQQNER